MTRLAEHLETSLGRAEAFAYVSDFSRQAEWDPNTVSSRRVDEGDPGVGARFALEVKVGSRVTPMEYRITEHEAPSRLVLVGEGSGIWTEDTITFRETAGATRVDYVAEIRLSGAMGLVQPLLGRAFAAIAREAVAGMKRELDRLAGPVVVVQAPSAGER